MTSPTEPPMGLAPGVEPDSFEPGAVRRAQVVGLGLVGSSIAGALRLRGWHVTGSDLDARRALRALELGMIDADGDDQLASVSFVATPSSSVAEIAEGLLSRSRAVVTDVAGVKGPILKALPDPRFVGGHPMAGSEQEGPDGADPDLFVGATWVLTPASSTDAGAFACVRSLVSSLGAEVVALSPERHDELVAIVSHVPHLTAATLMSLAGASKVDQAALMRLAAGGFRDMTRISAGSPSIWPDICRDNADAILPVLDCLIGRLCEVRRIVAETDRAGLEELLEQARAARQNLPRRGLLRSPQLTELRVLVPDRPGVLAEVTTLAGELGVNIEDLEIAHSAEGRGGVLVMVVATASADAVAGALRERSYRVAAGALK